MKNIFSACKKYGWILLSITTTNATVIPQKQLTKIRIAKKIRNKKLNDKKSKLALKASKIEKSASSKKKNYKKIGLIIGATILSIGGLYFYSSNSEKNNKQKNQEFDKLFQEIFEGKCNIPVTKPSASDDNDFTRSFEFGNKETEWNQDLGDLQQSIKLEDCQINPDFLHAVFENGINVTGQDYRFYPNSNSKGAGKRLIAIFDRLNFPANERFDHWEPNGQTCTKNEFCEALEKFDDIMVNGIYHVAYNVKPDTIKMFYYILGEMEKLDVGQNGNNPLSASQQENREKLQTLFKEIPTVMRECQVIFTAFIDEAVIALGLGSDHAITFTGKVYVYLLKYINTQLNGAVQTFIIRRYAWNHQVSLEYAQRAFLTKIPSQHAINGFKKELSRYINIDSNDLHSNYSEFTGFTKDKYYDSEPIIKMFLQYFYTEYLSAEKIVNHLAVAIPNSFNAEIPMKSYITFAHEKSVITSPEGLETMPLYDNGDFEKLNKNILTKILFNTKVFIKK